MVKLYKGQVYYPEGSARSGLYVNKKESKKKWRTSPRRGTGKEDLKAPRTCGLRCVAKSRTGERCKRRVCMDYRYCHTHLATEKHLLIAKSKRLSGFHLEGFGLYAYDPKHGSIKRDEKGLPIPSKTSVVFKKGDEIADYGGEILSKKQFDDRYEDPKDLDTGAYVESGTNLILDGLSAASAVTYSNESIDVASLMRRARDERSFERLYSEKVNGDRRRNAMTKQRSRMIRMVATKPIHQGEEILWNYGPTYWSSSGMKRYITGHGWDK